MSTPALFIYGSLAPGGPNEHVVRPLGGTWQRGTVQGELVQDGWGAELGYPGITLDTDSAGTVEGWLLRSELLDGNWRLLDDFEGDGYVRREVTVTLDDGTTATAWIYSLA